MPAPGEQIGDYELIRSLGSGAFATVFLARQVSLGRQVALKVSANRGTEARTLASLEHEHIVKVFSQDLEPERGLLLVCMQFVPGTTLEKVIDWLCRRTRRTLSGLAILEILETQSVGEVPFDAAALRGREQLGQCDYIEAVCLLGARIAEALAHAHHQKVLHRDIKPANILINPYGRPLLADFNIALDPDRVRGERGEVFGGTLAYMAPEHIDAFNPSTGVAVAAVDERSDIYSLGVVLFEMLTMQLPFEVPANTGRAALTALAEARRGGAPSPRHIAPDVPEVLDRVVRRCLDPVPEKRFQSAEELAQNLEGCREFRAVQKETPPAGWFVRLIVRWPFGMAVALIFLPHVLATFVNVAYNLLRIVRNISAEQEDLFLNRLIPAYNLVIYPVCLYLVARALAPVLKTWRALESTEAPNGAMVAAVRQHALRLPTKVWTIASLGWFPGSLFFPLCLSLFSGTVSAVIYGHFIFSFAASGLIAIVYSMFTVQFLVLRVFYPRLWIDMQDFRRTAEVELSGMERWLRVSQFLAGSVPLISALSFLVIIALGDSKMFELGDLMLLGGLILMGLVGFIIALLNRSSIGSTLLALRDGSTGRRRSRAGRSTTRRSSTPSSNSSTEVYKGSGSDG